MELLTTVRDFAHEITVRHLSPDTPIHVIIDEPDILIDTAASPTTSLPQITPEEQVHRLNRLPHDSNPYASAELVRIIETSHRNTDCIDL